MKPIIILVGLLLLILFLSSNMWLKKMTQTKTPPTAIAKPLADVLFPTKTPDDLPQNTLEIPRDKWGEKFPQLAERALKYFQDQAVAPQELPGEKKELYQTFIKSWGKPWRLSDLKTNFDNEELHLIWDQTLVVQANNPEELTKQKQIVEATLKKVQPSAELAETTNLSDHFATQQDVNKAIREGRLVELKMTNIKIAEKEYSIPQLAKVIENDLDPELSYYKDILEVSSSVRFLKLQTLLKQKLGYLAAKVSFHTKGAAIDLKLSDDAKKRFDAYLKEQVSGKTTRLDHVTLLYKQGTPLTVANLIKNGVLDKNYDVVAAFQTVEKAVRGKGVEIIDETFFGVRIDKEGRVSEINPVFHLQHPQ